MLRRVLTRRRDDELVVFLVRRLAHRPARHLGGWEGLDFVLLCFSGSIPDLSATDCLSLGDDGE